MLHLQAPEVSKATVLGFCVISAQLLECIDCKLFKIHLFNIIYYEKWIWTMNVNNLGSLELFKHMETGSKQVSKCFVPLRPQGNLNCHTSRLCWPKCLKLDIRAIMLNLFASRTHEVCLNRFFSTRTVNANDIWPFSQKAKNDCCLWIGFTSCRPTHQYRWTRMVSLTKKMVAHPFAVLSFAVLIIHHNVCLLVVWQLVTGWQYRVILYKAAPGASWSLLPLFYLWATR
ncbi:unnamed protein product [Arctogadus glacialis]